MKRLLRWTTEPCEAPESADPNPCPETPSPSPAPKPTPKRIPKRRPKRVQISSLYPTVPSEKERHARELLAFIAEYAPDTEGTYVPARELERYYGEDFCAYQGWQPFHWTSIARQLRDMTAKRTVKKNGIRRVCYQIPRAK